MATLSDKNIREVAYSMFGEGFHTAFRKCLIDVEGADEIWRLIRDLPDEAWSACIRWVVDPTLDELAERLAMTPEALHELENRWKS